MVKLADTQDLGSCAEKRAGSSPVIRTIASRLQPWITKNKREYRRIKGFLDNFTLSIPYIHSCALHNCSKIAVQKPYYILLKFWKIEKYKPVISTGLYFCPFQTANSAL